jgi:catechol 2,3-dioxygenase-like lactoylglutathione lyase family enzyme
MADPPAKERMPMPPTQDSDAGDLHLATVVVNVLDMKRAVAFWCDALGYELREPHLDPDFTMLQHPDGRCLPVSLQLTDHDDTGPVRIHLDLYTDHQDAQVERLVRLGASRVEDWSYPPDADFVVLRDPDGNEFCVIDHHDLA